MFDESDFASETDAGTNGDDDNNTDKEGETTPTPVPVKTTRTSRQRRQKPYEQDTSASVLTLEVGAEIETRKDKLNAVWHEIKNSQLTGSHLTGTLGKVERLENGGIIAIVDYQGQRICVV